MNDDLISKLAEILRRQQGIYGPITRDSRICGELGVCDGDFQDYMAEVWKTFGIQAGEIVELDVPERLVTLCDVARWVENAR